MKNHPCPLRINNNIIKMIKRIMELKISYRQGLPNSSNTRRYRFMSPPPEPEFSFYLSIIRDAVRGGDMDLHRRAIHDPECVVFKRHSLGDPPLRGQVADICCIA
jgi:hypothetical protein